MELRQIEHFVAVVEEGHFTRAAHRCNVSQSALSASIKSLERDVDTPLLVRTTRHVELTDAGRALLGKARDILAAVAAAKDAVSATQGRLGGSLGVGGVQTTGVLDQGRLLAQFHAEHPEVEIRYKAAMSWDLIDAVRDGQLDVAFIAVPARSPLGVELEALASYPMMFVCRVDHPLASRPVVDLDMLDSETFVGVPRHAVMNDALARVTQTRGTRKRMSLMASDISSALEFVANGLGVALLPSYLAEARAPLVAVPLSDPTMIWTIGVAIAPPDRRTRAAQALLDIVHAM